MLEKFHEEMKVKAYSSYRVAAIGLMCFTIGMIVESILAG